VQDGGEGLYRPYVVWTLPIIKIYRGLQMKSDGWQGWRLSIIPHYAYCCIPNQAPLSHLNYARKLVTDEVYHVVICTNNRMNWMATWLERDTGAGRGTKRNLSGDVEVFSPFQFFSVASV
jgi:hypothetical protein